MQEMLKDLIAMFYFHDDWAVDPENAVATVLLVLMPPERHNDVFLKVSSFVSIRGGGLHFLLRNHLGKLDHVGYLVGCYSQLLAGQ